MSLPDPETAGAVLQNHIVQLVAKWIGEIIFALCLGLMLLLKFIGKKALADIDSLKDADVVSRDEMDDCRKNLNSIINDRFNSLEDLIRNEIRTVHGRVDDTLGAKKINANEEE